VKNSENLLRKYCKNGKKMEKNENCGKIDKKIVVFKKILK